MPRDGALNSMFGEARAQTYAREYNSAQLEHSGWASRDLSLPTVARDRPDTLTQVD